MVDLSLERKFRLLHSWRAKAEKLLLQCPKEQEKQAAALRKAVDRATAELKTARRREEARLEELAGTLREQLDALSASGTIRLDAPGPASDDNNPALTAIEAIRKQIARYNNVLGVASADELGGFLDLPIEEYPVALGLRRNAAGNLSPFASTPKRVAIAAMLAAVLGIMGTLLYLQGAKSVKVRIDAPQDGVVAVHLLNETGDTLAFWIPFQEQRSSTETTAVNYGLHLQGRASGEERASLLPIGMDHWQVPGIPGTLTLPLTVGPGLSLTVDINVQQIRRDYGPFEEMMLRCVDHSGKIVGEAIYALPAQS